MILCFLDFHLSFDMRETASNLPNNIFSRHPKFDRSTLVCLNAVEKSFKDYLSNHSRSVVEHGVMVNDSESRIRGNKF